MKESHEVRPSQSPWPRVMRCVGQLAHRSVHRGTTGLCIELRKHLFVAADLVLTREGRLATTRTGTVFCNQGMLSKDAGSTDQGPFGMNFNHGYLLRCNDSTELLRRWQCLSLLSLSYIQRNTELIRGWRDGITSTEISWIRTLNHASLVEFQLHDFKSDFDTHK
jgi:hypothetical protein